MKIYFGDSLDRMEDCPEVFLKKVYLQSDFNHVCVRRHHKRFRRVVKERGGLVKLKPTTHNTDV